MAHKWRTCPIRRGSPRFRRTRGGTAHTHTPFTIFNQLHCTSRVQGDDRVRQFGPLLAAHLLQEYITHHTRGGGQVKDQKHVVHTWTHMPDQPPSSPSGSQRAHYTHAHTIRHILHASLLSSQHRLSPLRGNVRLVCTGAAQVIQEHNSTRHARWRGSSQVEHVTHTWAPILDHVTQLLPSGSQRGGH